MLRAYSCLQTIVRLRQTTAGPTPGALGTHQPIAVLEISSRHGVAVAVSKGRDEMLSLFFFWLLGKFDNENEKGNSNG